jgi:predicted flap endonuclease-1-like 5' DNA nuclease
MAFLTEYWPIILAAVLIGLVTGYYYFKPRQRVSLSDNAPLRPHMTKGGEGKSVADEAAAATSDVAGQILGTKVHAELPGASGAPDDLQKLKGVGPKMAALLNERGITRFDQIASLSPGQVETIDASLGAFKGRFARDRIVEQADYLARGDTDGYALKFGNL